MRTIEVEEGLSIRFPERGSEFADGVEMGMLALEISSRRPVLSRTISSHNVDQARVLANKLGYRVVDAQRNGEWTRITVHQRGIRPLLRVVSDAGARRDEADAAMKRAPA